MRVAAAGILSKLCPRVSPFVTGIRKRLSQTAPVIEWDEDVLDIVEPYFLFFLRWAPSLMLLTKDRNATSSSARLFEIDATLPRVRQFLNATQLSNALCQ